MSKCSVPEMVEHEMSEHHESQREKGQVWILSKDAGHEWRVLLLKTKPERGSFWQPVTGSIEAGETIQKGALREAIEETGLPPMKNIEALGFDFSFQGKWGAAHETAFYYETYAGCPKATLDPREHTDFQWAKPSAAFELLHYEPNRQALTQLIRKLEKISSKKTNTEWK
ncbi:MAG: NUDIX domain-containing protein [Cryobacterium sp.]|nr:NUDIX domain-containing protein [Oligoflexia bacterium]